MFRLPASNRPRGVGVGGTQAVVATVLFSVTVLILSATDAIAAIVPATPTSVAATATGAATVEVNWNASTGAEWYRVLRGGMLISSSVTGSVYVDAGLAPNTRYSYQVAACSSRGCSAKSLTASATTQPLSLQPPTGLTVAADARGHVTATWVPSTGATWFSVARSGVTLRTEPSLSRYVDWGASPSTAYSYAVRACSRTACSKASPTVALTTPAVGAPPSCSGVPVRASDSIQAAINTHAVGTTFCLSAGLYHLTAPVIPKSQDVVWGVPGTVLTGDGSTAQAIRGNTIYQHDVTVRGVSLQDFAGTAIELGNDWQVEDSEVARSGGVGLRLQDGSTVRDSRFHHNGRYGISGYDLGGVLVEGNVVAFNNTRHAIDGSAGGAKVLRSSNVTFRGNYIHDNYYNGLHCDTDCINLTFEQNVIEANTGVGLLYEKGFDALIRDNLIAGNDALFAGKSVHFGANLRLNTSRDVEMYGNTVEATVLGTNGISLADYDRGSGPLGTYVLANDYVHDNVVRLLVNGQSGLVGNAHDPTHANSRFVANDYFVPATGAQYFAWGVYPLPWPSWRAEGQDQSGSLSQG